MVAITMLKEDYAPYVADDSEWLNCPSGSKVWRSWKDAHDHLNDHSLVKNYFVLLVRANWSECVEVENENFRHLPETRRILGVLEV